ncbi:peptidylprolyl isomerase [Marinicella sp. S1101]|uniref:peptidylprolyl isomerase n=1 Tax=Marinicella marina TaxID=2996016 RepID=UPI002260F631|nr:peptidylprolyl isomerase [Marinicella marina]MCX7553302.1 peptidylprolyl isomerase [Marinicella marina]MDJ1139034.1 peptidylprolyl isomerase [Marinicella marina]
MRNTLIILFLTTTFVATGQELLDEIVAVVDDNVIMRSELDRATESIKKQIEASGNQTPPAEILNSQVLERLIIQEIQIARAEQAGIRIPDNEIDAALANIAAQNGLTLEQMQQAVESDGFSFADFRRDMKRDMQAERVRYAYANSTVKISDHEIDLFLADNELDQGEVEIQHILIATSSDNDASATEAAQTEANELYEKIQSGENFAALATQFSDGQKALEGGRLGWRPVNQLPPLFADQVTLMSPGEVTRPIRSPSGFHILKLLDKKSETIKTVDQYNMLHIMIETDEVVSARDGMEIANGLHEKIMAGEDFSKLAEEHSDDHSSAPLGGDMGWFEINKFGPRMADVIAGLEVNEVSNPFQTDVGWHIIKFLGKKEADVTTEFRREQASNAIRQRKVEEEIESWIRQIRGEAFVDIRL